MLNTVVNKVDPVTGQTLVKEKTLEELANCSVLDAPAVETQPVNVSDSEDEEQAQNGKPKRKTQYEPHIVAGSQDGSIRGIFRMDPRFDPNCKPKKKPKKPVKRDTAASMKRLTSREEVRSMISTRKAQIED